MRIEKENVHPYAAAAIAALLFSLPALSYADATTDAERRTELSNKGKALFKKYEKPLPRFS